MAGRCGLHSHWLDPTEPLALAVLSPADGVIITSATLKDRPPNVPDDWENAEMRTGAIHLPYPVKREQFASPFDYPKRARVIVVNDVGRDRWTNWRRPTVNCFLPQAVAHLGCSQRSRVCAPCKSASPSL